MFDYFLTYNIKIINNHSLMTFSEHHSTIFVVANVATLLKFRILASLLTFSQPRDKTEFSRTAKNRTNSVS